MPLLFLYLGIPFALKWINALKLVTEAIFDQLTAKFIPDFDPVSSRKI